MQKKKFDPLGVKEGVEVEITVQNSTLIKLSLTLIASGVLIWIITAIGSAAFNKK